MLARMLRVATAVAAVVGFGAGVVACGSTPAATTTDSGLVSAPDLSYNGCTYAPNGKVPAGEPAGIRPHFSVFSPDSAAMSAEQSIRAGGGGVLVNSFILPNGTELHAGPDSSGSVGVVPSHYAILAAEPVVWHSHSGDTWIAFFVACGGRNLYWVSLDQLRQNQAATAKGITVLLTTDKLVPLSIRDGHFVWKSTGLKLVIGRGELFGPVAS